MERLPKELLQEIASLQNKGRDELLRGYGSLIGYDVKDLRPDFLRKKIAYRLQEVHYGISLSPRDVKRLKALAARKDGRGTKEPDAIGKTGTRLCRVWKGVEHEVTLQSDGKVAYNGFLFSSLTAVAKHITGTHWNGRKFFGVA